MTSTTKNEQLSSNQTSDSHSQSWVEPSPNWLEAIKEWKWLWQVNVHGVGTIFALIAFFAIICLVLCRKTIFTRHRVHIAVMNTALVTTGFLRSLILFWDP